MKKKIYLKYFIYLGYKNDPDKACNILKYGKIRSFNSALAFKALQRAVAKKR